MSDHVFAFHFLCWNQAGPFLSQYHTFWERLGQLWCLESRAQGHPAHPQSRWNHLLQAIGQLFWPSDSRWRHSCKYNKKRCRSPIMRKALMRSHCKAMCYRKLANCSGRVTAIGDIHAASKVLSVVFPRDEYSTPLKSLLCRSGQL